jgi:hypothetical protein
MAQLRATFLARLRRLIVARELLGTSHEIPDWDGHRVVLTVPNVERQAEDPDAAAPVDPTIFPDHEEPPLVEGGAQILTSVHRVPHIDFAEIDALRVRVYWQDEISAASFERDDFQWDDLPGWSESFETPFHAAEQVARETTARFTSWLRVRAGQPWLALSGEPARLVGTAYLSDMDAGQRLPITHGLDRGPVFSLYKPEQVLQPNRFSELLELASSGHPVPLPEELLADARFYLIAGEANDAPRALLSAAIATELKVKETLRGTVRHGNAALLDVLLASPRDYSVAAFSLFDDVMEVVAGVSLRKADRDLFKRVQRLFEKRNALAHRGELPDEEEAKVCVGAAGQAFRWLDTISPVA